MKHRGTRVWTAAGAALALALLQPAEPGAQRFVEGDAGGLPKIKYADSLVSLNDRCIVAGNRLNVRIRPVYVSGAPIGFC